MIEACLDQSQNPQDSGDSLEDFWEETSSYLSDEFNAGPLPRPRPVPPANQKFGLQVVDNAPTFACLTRPDAEDL